MKKLTLSILAGLLMSSCTDGNANTEVCYYHEGAIEQFKGELDKKGYSFEEPDNSQCVLVSGLSDAEHQKIREGLFGVSPPPNLSVAWPIRTYMIHDGKKYEER